MKILVIGGTRFLGPAVVERLIEGGHEVTLFHRGRSEPEDAPALAQARHLHGDRERITDFRDDFRALAPDVVLDMAPMFGRHTTSLLDAVRGATSRVVAISSVDVYRAYGRLHRSEPGEPDPVPLTETSPLRQKLYPYRGQRDGKMDDYDKIPIERAVMSDTDIAGTVLRLPAVHGERDYQHRCFMEVARMDAGREAMFVQQGADTWRWPRAYAGNIADAIALAVTDQRAAGRIYNVAEPHAMTTVEWIAAIARVTGWDGEIVVADAEDLPEGLRSKDDHRQDMSVDSSRIRAELGYGERVPQDEGIARAVAWERAHPPAKVDPKWIDFDAEDAALTELRR